MTERSVIVRLRAEVADYRRAMEDAARATDKIPASAQRANTALGQMVQSAQYNRESWDRAGRTMAAFGTVTVGGLALAGKAAVDWESQWTGVTKTVNGSASELAGLQDQLREMARTLPSSHEEIAAVAEAAGQLGIQTPNIAAFTRTVIDLGQTTNLSAQDAAVGLARFANVMGTAQTDFDRLGSVIVGLGNNYATTESEILAMSQRLASASRVVGLSESDTLGLAAALSSVGIEAEAGGSAVSRVMIKISQAVDAGGDKLDQFAQLAGTNAGTFAQQWRTSPVDALLAVVQGLSQMTEAGQGTFGVLQDLGLQDIRVTNALLGLSNATDLTKAAVAQASTEWEKNNALLIEAEKRYDTAQSKIEVAKNSIVDAGISLGQTFLPAIADASQGVADFAGWLAQLPTPVQQSVALLGGLTGTTALAAGAFLLLFPRVMDTVLAFRTLRTTTPGLTTAIGRIGTRAAWLGAILGTANVAGTLLTSTLGDITLGSNEAAAAVDALADSTSTATALFGELNKTDWWQGPNLNTGGLSDAEALKRVLDQIADPGLTTRAQLSVSKILGLYGTTDIARYTQRLQDLGGSLATVATQDLPKAVDAFRNLRDMAGGTDNDARQLLQTMPDLRDALIGIANGAGLATDDATLLSLILGDIVPKTSSAADSMDGLSAAADGAAGSTDEAAKALQEWKMAVIEADQSFIGLTDAYQGVIDQNTELAQSTADATKTSKDSWTDYYDGTSVSADEFIAKLQEQVDAQNAWEQNLLDLTGRLKKDLPPEMQLAVDQMINELNNLGPEGAATVQLLHDMSDEELARVVTLYREKGAAAANDFANQLNALLDPPAIKVHADLTPANSEVLGWIEQQRQRSVWFNAHANVTVDYNGSASGSGKPGFAGGGEITGPYVGPTADNVLIRANPKEWVHSVAAVDYWGKNFMDSVNRRDLAAVVRSLPGRAEGGPVGVEPRYLTAITASPMPAQVERGPVEVVGAKYNGPVYVVDPDEIGRKQAARTRDALATYTGGIS